MSTIETKEKELNVYGCSNCGAELKYKPGTTTLVCEYCDTKNEIIQEEIVVEELDFEKYIENLESENLQLEKVIKCKSCGSTSAIDESLKSLHCAYCTAPLVEDDIQEDRFIKPAYLLPFSIENKKVYDQLSNWVNGLWWAPNNLKKAALSPIGLRGVYVPYWTFDTQTHSNYTGERGRNYTVTVGDGDDERQETRTDWSFASGQLSLFFDDIMVPASGNIDSSSLSQLEPWDTSSLVKTNDQYLSGFVTEKYMVKLKEGFVFAKTQIDRSIHNAVQNDIGGDQQRIHSINSQYNNIQFKHILLPVYVSSYSFDNKMYHFYVNGRNGKLVGERPYSVAKISLAILSVLIMVAFVIYCYQLSQK